MRRCFAILCATVLFAATAMAADGSIRIRAASMTARSDGTLVAEGGVTIVGQGITAHADRMTYDPARSFLSLSGNVLLEDRSGGRSTGDTMDLDLGTMEGGIKGGEIILEPTGYRIRGESIRRLAPDEYEVKKGTLTSCPGDCPDWSLTASKIRVKKEGYLTARNVTFRLAGIPVFYSPYLVYPVKAGRQTGFLLPEVGFTDARGWEAYFPFFATLGQSADLTLTPETFSRDRMGLNGEFRYLLPYGGGGRWSGFAIGDRGDGGNTGRYFVSGSHAFAILPGFWMRGRWYDAGNFNTPADFGATFDQRNPGLVDRHISLDFGKGGISLWAGLSDLASNGATVRTGPTLGRAEAGAAIGPVSYGAGTAALSMDVTRFEGGDERFLITPRLSADWDGPGGLAGRLSGEWTGSAEIEGSSSDSMAVVTLEERLALSRSFSWGLHRLDISLLGGVADGYSFATTGSRDGLDAGRESSVVAGHIRSRINAGALNWDLQAGVLRDFHQEESVVFGRTSLRRGPWFLGGTWNRDAKYGLILPIASSVSTQSHGWTVETGYETDRLMLRVTRNEADGSPGVLSGSYRVSLGAFRVSGTAQYDLDAEDISDDTRTITYGATCWELALTQSRNRGGTRWKLNAAVRY